MNITSNEALTWETIFHTIAAAAGVDPSRYASQVVHVPSDALIASYPSAVGGVLGDKMHNKVVGTRLLRTLVPGFQAKTRFADGIRQSISWFEEDPSRQSIDSRVNAHLDRLGAIYRRSLEEASHLPTLK